MKINKRIANCAFLFLSLSILPAKSFGQKTISDTTFLERQNKNGAYHAVFIDPDKNSASYNHIAAFSFNQFDDYSYQSSLEYLKKQNPKPFEKHDLLDLPAEWCSVYMYNGNYYLYSPSDYMFNFRVAMSDTTFIEYYGDGPMASRINTFGKVDDKTYLFNISSYDEPVRLEFIHIIDKEKGIAVFENLSEDGDNAYSLMVRADKIKDLPVIVNFCATQKWVEYKFDKPNFEKLLNLK